MTKLQEWIRTAGAALDVEVVTTFEVVLSSGRAICAEALVVGLGAPKGMLIVTSMRELGAARQELVSQGYGYSVLSEPTPNEEFDLDSFKEMFEDWRG